MVVVLADSTVVVPAGMTVTEKADETEPSFTVSPLYMAKMLYAEVLKGKLITAEAVPELSASVAKAAPFTMNCTVPVGLLPATAVTAVKDVPKGVVDGTLDNVVVVLPRLPALTVMT